MNCSSWLPFRSSYLFKAVLIVDPLKFNETYHQVFDNDLPTFYGFREEIRQMSSLQKPKKITIHGSDGKEYNFLCKPNDDLKKDSRLMEFNSIINKLLKKDGDAGKRGLCT